MRASVALTVLLFAASPACAGEDSDLDLIPGAVNQDAPAMAARPATGIRSLNLKADESATFSSMRDNPVVPMPGGAQADWQNRLSLDGRVTYAPADRLSLTLSDRLTFTGDDVRGFPKRQNFRNDLREAFITGEPVSRTFLEAGRINVKNGVATGYNPTDFFKPGTQVDQSSSDPSALRENRLGTLMVRAQTLWDGGSASLIYAPKLSRAPELGRAAPTLDPQFDATNHSNRVLATLDLDVADLSPQFLVFQEGDRTRFGFNASKTIANSVVAYVEWAGGRERSLTDAADDYGRRSGAFPATMPKVMAGSGERFRNDLAAGFSWTSEYKVTVNAEYHFHQAGMSGGEWDDWFSIGQRNGSQSAPALWHIRSYASFLQQPATKHRGFIRVAWTDAFVPKLELTGFTTFNLTDGSGLAQIQASYPLSDTWSVSTLATANYGNRRTEFGSLPEAASAIVQLVRYF